jgi:hypothetical protein
MEIAHTQNVIGSNFKQRIHVQFFVIYILILLSE